MKKIMGFILAIVLCLGLIPSRTFAEDVSHNPIIEPNKIGTSTATKDRFTNVLLLGVDYGFPGYWGSHHKKVLQECHTDAFMVFSINMTTSDVNLISIPRDTVTYVPGVRGVYKLNSAVNCADDLNKAFQRCCDAASWMLGGVRIDYYACVDMNAMIKLCDHIGGAEVDVEMGYNGGNGRYYSSGRQHLDGQGLMDYARARKNATRNANDLGRTSRQRQVVEAIFNAMKKDPSKIKSAWKLANNGELNFFTNLKLGTILNLLNKVRNDKDTVGSYVLTGEYHKAAHWNFTFTDQKNRIDVLKAVFGIEASEIPYVSREYVNWLFNSGFDYVHAINLGKQILFQGKGMTYRSAEQEAALKDFETIYNSMVKAFDAEADATNEGKSTSTEIKTIYEKLQNSGNKAAIAIGFSTENLNWRKASSWNNDPLINEYQPDWA